MPDLTLGVIDSFAEPIMNRTERIEYISGEYLSEVEVLSREVTGDIDTTLNSSTYSTNKSVAINGEVEIELSYLTDNLAMPTFSGVYETPSTLLEVTTNAKSIFPAGTTTTEYGSNVIVNPTFLGLNQWQAFSATLDVGGAMTQLGDYPAFSPRVNQVIDTVIGQKYRVRTRVVTNGKELNIRAVNNAGAFEALADTYITNFASETIDLFFVAISDSTAISLRGRGDLGDVFNLQEVNCISITDTTYASDTTDIVSVSKAYLVLNGYLDKRVDSYTLDDSILRSTDVIYVKEGEKVYIPTYNIAAFSESITTTNEEFTTYSAIYQTRVPIDGGTLESVECLEAQDFLTEPQSIEITTTAPTGIADNTNNVVRYMEIDTEGYDNISISSSSGREIKIIQLEKCDNIKLTFINKYGVLEDIWMSGSVVENIALESRNFKGRSIASGVYRPTKHEKVDLNRQGKGNYILNSGFYSEDYNEVFKQLMLSRSVWLTIDGLLMPVNVKNNSLSYKTNHDDKLISYTIQVERASGTINKMR